MDQRNEGDAIIFLALKQIESPILLSSNLSAVSELNADNIVDIVARSLNLICNDESKFPTSLPSNIASRHRICTTLAAKIKELGFSSDCGYNQLLYPVESQIRALLTWLVQKLPRSEEERAEEVLGTNALINRRVSKALMEWKQSSWVLPRCAKGRILHNSFTTDTLRTFPINQIKSFNNLISQCANNKLSAEPSVFERHTQELLFDATYSSFLERDFDESKGGEDTSQSLLSKAKTTERLNAIIRNAISAERTNGSSSSSLVSASSSSSSSSAAEGTAGAAGAGALLSVASDKVSEMKLADQMNSSLQDLIASIGQDDADSQGQGKAKLERGTRFAHAIEFAQESSVPLGGGGGGGDGPLLSLSSSGSGGGSHHSKTNSSIAGSSSSSSSSSTSKESAAEIADRKLRLEEEEKARDQELDDLRANIAAKQSEGDVLDRRFDNVTVTIRQLESEVAALNTISENLEKDALIKKKTLEMLPMATENIGKLQVICGNGATRLMQLALEWETHRRPLVDKIRMIKSSRTKRRTKCKQMVEEMKKVREEMTSMVQDLKDKQDKFQLLEDEMKKLPKNINRALYTHRILDIIASIAKQNKEISHITSDIRDIQKSINASTSALQRADAVTEERIYAAANSSTGSSDPALVAMYRQLRMMRASFEELVSTLSKIGQSEKSTRDYETKIEQESSRVSANNFERIRTDLEEVTKENAQLVNLIKSAGKK